MIRLFTSVDAIIVGVKSTPPPIPPITATSAIAKDRRKKPRSQTVISPPDIPSFTCSSPIPMIASPT